MTAPITTDPNGGPDPADADTTGCARHYLWHAEAAQMALDGLSEELAVDLLTRYSEASEDDVRRVCRNVFRTHAARHRGGAR